jgi:ABC-type glycerol-3-phosphate transport system substrate-binding protein
VITGVLLATLLSAKVRGQAIYKDQVYELCNCLDIHALYYHKTILEQYGLQPPQTISDLDEIASALALFNPTDKKQRYGYIPIRSQSSLTHHRLVMYFDGWPATPDTTARTILPPSEKAINRC